MKNIDLAARISAAKEKVRVADAWRLLNLPTPPRAGTVCVKSPFRPEKSASFSLFKERRAFKDHADDTVKGDVICFIRIAAHCSNREAIATLLEWAGDREPLGHRKHDGKIILPSAPVAVENRPTTTPEPAGVPKDDPDADPFGGTRIVAEGTMMQLRIAKSRDLAEYWRGLNGLCAAGILRSSNDRDMWLLVDGPKMPDNWMAAECRNLSRKPFGHGAKCHTIKGSKKSWLVGLSMASADLNQTMLVVEGGPDLLAAHILVRHLRRADVHPVAFMGREISQLCPEARKAIAGRDVLILPHRDKSKAGELTDGQDAAVKWARMLLNDCGATDVFMSSLEGLTRPDGQPAKDLCEAIEDGGLGRNAGVLAELLPPAKEQTIETI